MAEDKQHKVVRYLEDAYASEQGGLKSLKALADEATDSELKAVVTTHLEQTQRQADRIEQRITALGGTANAGKSIIDQAVALGSHIVNALHDPADKQTQDTIKALALEGFEIGAYTALEAYAAAVGDTETATLAQSILSEEQQAHDQLLKLIPQLSRAALDTAA